MEDDGVYAFRTRVDYTKVFDDLTPTELSRSGGEYMTGWHRESFRPENVLEVIMARPLKWWNIPLKDRPIWVKFKLFSNLDFTGCIQYVDARDLEPAEGYEELRQKITNLPEASKWPKRSW